MVLSQETLTGFGLHLHSRSLPCSLILIEHELGAFR